MHAIGAPLYNKNTKIYLIIEKYLNKYLIPYKFSTAPGHD